MRRGEQPSTLAGQSGELFVRECQDWKEQKNAECGDGDETQKVCAENYELGDDEVRQYIDAAFQIADTC